MKEEDSKNQNTFSQTNNPFLTRALKPIKDSNQASDKSNESHKDIKNVSEHRASKFINLPNNFKNSKTIFTEKKQNEVPKNLNSKSPKNKINLFGDKNKGNENQGGFVSVLNKFISQEKIKKSGEKEESKKFRKRASVEKYINSRLQENFKKNNEIDEPKNFNTNQNDNNEEKKDKISSDIKIQVTTKAGLENKVNNTNNNSKKENGLIYFKNDDEILEYIKNKVKEGKIQNILQKLEIKNNNFSGFSICKKNNGYTTCEIDVEDDIQKINEVFKNQKITIKNKPIKLVYADENDIKSKQGNDNINESNISKVKNESENSPIYMEKLKDKINNKALENQNIKNEKMNNEIKNLQDKITKYKEELKENDRENDPKRNVNQPVSKDANNNKQSISNISASLDSKSKKTDSGIKVNAIQKSPEEQTNPPPPEIVPAPNDKKEVNIANKNKRVSNAYIRFRRACSLHKDKPPTSTNSGNVGGSKIQSLASMLQDHIIKPLAEIQEEKETGKKVYRGASVECSRKSKIGDDNFVLLFQNAPVTKKKVKKPKLNNFVE